jgi:hypothetical protein
MEILRMGIRSKPISTSRKLNVLNAGGWGAESSSYQNH